MFNNLAALVMGCALSTWCLNTPGDQTLVISIGGALI